LLLLKSPTRLGLGSTEVAIFQQGNGLGSRHLYVLKDAIRRQLFTSALHSRQDRQRRALTAQLLLPQYDPLGWPSSRPERVQRLFVPTRELRPIGRMSQLHYSQRKRTVVECDSYRRSPWFQYPNRSEDTSIWKRRTAGSRMSPIGVKALDLLSMKALRLLSQLLLPPRKHRHRSGHSRPG